LSINIAITPKKVMYQVGNIEMEVEALELAMTFMLYKGKTIFFLASSTMSMLSISI
jgi:hypothetical protein